MHEHVLGAREEMCGEKRPHILHSYDTFGSYGISSLDIQRTRTFQPARETAAGGVGIEVKDGYASATWMCLQK